jgi:transcriptional regulator with XRE-family HTH domain
MASSDSTARRPGERQWLADAFGRALRDLVSERDMDYATLADRSGIRQPALDRLCAGTRLPDLDTLFVIARALDLTPEALVARTAWFDVVAAAMKAPETYSAIAIYCRIAFFQPG